MMHLHEALRELMRRTHALYEEMCTLNSKNLLRQVKIYDSECLFVQKFSRKLTDNAIHWIRQQECRMERVSEHYEWIVHDRNEQHNEFSFIHIGL